MKKRKTKPIQLLSSRILSHEESSFFFWQSNRIDLLFSRQSEKEPPQIQLNSQQNQLSRTINKYIFRIKTYDKVCVEGATKKERYPADAVVIRIERKWSHVYVFIINMFAGFFFFYSSVCCVSCSVFIFSSLKEKYSER